MWLSDRLQVMNLKRSALLECNYRSVAVIYEDSCESRFAAASPLPVPPQQGHEHHETPLWNLDEIGDAWGGTSLANTSFRGQITRLKHCNLKTF